ncbi:MAG: L-threonylcarbamoyladenylate synthase [Nocardioides sp.]
MTAKRYATSTEDEQAEAVAAAAMAIHRGQLIVFPTDTVYGVGADAFDPESVQDLLDAKGRGRQAPPPVLVSAVSTLDALATDVPDYARALVAEFWPGALTVVCNQQASLRWDLGETYGTVALRMPDHPIALAVLARTGPLAVSSANLTGEPAATTADEAMAMLGESVSAILDAGPSPGAASSTIIDATGPEPRLLRAGALAIGRLNDVLTPLGCPLSDEGPEPGA